MAKEIERKFLVTDYSWKALPAQKRTLLEQGYFPASLLGQCRLYIIISPDSDKAHITIDGADQHCFIEVTIDKDNDFASIINLPCYNKRTGELTLGDIASSEARIRTSENLDTDEITAKFTIKQRGLGDSSDEFEISVPYSFAEHVFKTIIIDTVKKERTAIDYHGFMWEVDSYLDKNQGLVTADVEVAHESDFDTLKKLPGASYVVSKEPSLRNRNLIHTAAPEQFKIK